MSSHSNAEDVGHEAAAGSAAWVPVEVGDRGDADDLGERGRHEAAGIGGGVAGAADEHHAGGGRGQIAACRASLTQSPQSRDSPKLMDATSTSLAGLPSVFEPGHVIEAAQDQRLGRVAGVVEDLDRDQLRLGRDAHHAGAVQGSGGRPGHVRAVPVAVIRRSGWREAVLAAGLVDAGSQVRMVEVDAGVDDRDPRAGAAEAVLVGPARRPGNGRRCASRRREASRSARRHDRVLRAERSDCFARAAAAAADPTNWKPFTAWRYVWPVVPPAARASCLAASRLAPESSSTIHESLFTLVLLAAVAEPGMEAVTSRRHGNRCHQAWQGSG